MEADPGGVGDPYQYSYGNRKPRVLVLFSRWGLDSPSPLDLRMGRWGRGGTDKSPDVFLILILLKGSN